MNSNRTQNVILAQQEWQIIGNQKNSFFKEATL
jgi:hypothetical protein